MWTQSQREGSDRESKTFKASGNVLKVELVRIPNGLNMGSS